MGVINKSAYPRSAGAFTIPDISHKEAAKVMITLAAKQYGG